MVFLVVILIIWRPKKSFSGIISVLSKIRDSSLMPYSHNCFDCDNSFHPSGAFQESFQFDSPEPIISELFILSFQLSSGASFIYPLISSWSLRSYGSKFSQVSSFILQFFPVICAFATFNFNSYGGSFKSSLFLVIISIHSFFPNPTGGSLKTFSSLRHISLNPFYKNKWYAKSVACHQFKWWGICIM